MVDGSASRKEQSHRVVVSILGRNGESGAACQVPLDTLRGGLSDGVDIETFI